MVTARQIIVGLLAVLIVLSAVGANAAIATDRTVLDEEHVTERLQDADVLDTAVEEAQADFADELEDETEDEPIGVDTQGVIDAVDEQYLANELERNVGNLLQFLRGDAETLDLYLDVSPIRDDLSLDGDDVTVDTAGLIDGTEFQVDEYDLQISGEMVTQLRASQADYDAVRAEIRADVREQIAAADPRIDDPSDVPPEVVDDALVEINANAKEQADGEARDELGADAAQDTLAAAVDLQTVVIDGLTLPSYDDQPTYERDLADAETAVAAAIAEEITEELFAELDETDNRIQIGDDLEDDLDEDLGAVELALSGIATATWLLPLLVVVLAGGIFFVSKSAHTTGMASGTALLIAGIAGLLAGTIGGSFVTDTVEAGINGDEEALGANAATAIIDAPFAALTTQSVVLIVLGAVLAGVAYADRAGYIALSSRLS